ncbi:MAG: DEAD/DEAH box helicase [Nanoarchaeota archaeon]
MNEFEKLGLGKGLLETIKKMKFEKPSEIQEKAIPFVLKGKDVIGQAATGSGKTLAFGSAIIQNMKKGEGVKALVMTPTRELAEQVAQALRKFSENYGWEIVEIYGGVSINPQINRLEEADIVVGTPGRILDHLNRRTLNLQRVQFLVLDEADRMVDMGFLPDVEKIIRLCPKKRQTLLFSATMTPDIDYVSESYLTHPKQVTVMSYVDPSKLKQIFYDVQAHEKFSLFLHLIKEDKSDVSMVFCNTRGNVETVIDNLNKFGVKAIGIHGGMNQVKRSKVMEDFHKQHAHVLVCTDVAARGLDIKCVTHIYNYDVPKDHTDYIHRIGRTARAGKEGEAISLVCSNDYASFRRVLDDPKINIEQEKLPEFEKVRPRFSKREDDYGGRGGDRGGRGGSRGGFGGDRGNRRYGTYGTGGPRRGGSGGSRGRDGGSRGGGRPGGSYGRSRDSGSRGGGRLGGSYGGSKGGSRTGGSRGGGYGSRGRGGPRSGGSYGSRGGGYSSRGSNGGRRDSRGGHGGSRGRDSKSGGRKFGGRR